MPDAVVITGAGSGIGRLAALAFLRSGWRVALAGRSAGALASVQEEATRLPGQSLAVPTDVTDPAAVARLFDAAATAFGHIDVLFNNAGSFAGGAPFDQISLADWNAAIAVNLTGSFLCAQEAFRRMKAQAPQGGRIINNGSVSAQVPRPHAAAYTASKHAVTGLTKAMSLEGRAFGIACGQIDVGNAATDMTAGMATGMLQADGSVRPEPRMDARHVADAVLWMARLPLAANVQFITLAATGMPLVGRG